MLNRIARDSVDFRGGIDLLDAVDAAQITSTDLARSRLKIGIDCAKGEHTAGAHTEHAADDSLFSHANSNERMFVAPRLQELHHGHVVEERRRRADDLIEVRWDFQHLLQRVIKIARGTKIMERQNQSGPAAQPGNRLWLRFQRALQFQIDKLTARRVRLGKHFQFSSQRSLKLAPIVGAPAGANRGHKLIGLKKTMDFGKRGQWLLQVVQAELHEGVIPSHGLRRGEHVVNGIAAQCQTDLGQAHGQKPGRESRRQSQGHLFSTTARYYKGAAADATSRCN